MITKEEFKELKEKYPEAFENAPTLITDYFPEKLFLTSINKRNRKIYLIEITEYKYVIYGLHGNPIEGDPIIKTYWFHQIKIQGLRGRKLIRFFDENTYISVNTLQLLFKNSLKELVLELRRNKIPIKNISRFLYHDHWVFRKDVSEQNLIKYYFDLSAKDLRQLQENYKYGWQPSNRKKLEKLKILFGQPTKEVCKYLAIGSLLGKLHTTAKKDWKDLRTDFRYYYKVYESSSGVYWYYIDYVRILNLLPTELKKRFPKYPQDLDKIVELHDQATDIFNREQDRIRAAKNAELQKKYDEKFYQKAKKYEFSNDEYSIIACKELIDLTKEGRDLNHCVGSYIESVGNGREYILFLRKNSDIEKSFYTIDITPDNKVRQIHGFRNCNLTDELKPFINEWAKKFKLDASHCSGIYCHL